MTISKETEMLINKSLIDMRLMNIIKDEDEMKYTFPNQDVYLIIKREYSNVPVVNGPSYIITISLYGIYGNKMFDIKTDEVNMARIVDCMNYFNTELGGYGDSMDIELTPCDNSNFEYVYFHLERIPNGTALNERVYPNGEPVYNPHNYDDMDWFDIKLEIRKYSKIYETLNVMYSTLLNTTALDNLAYSLFFVSLIDLDPNDYNSKEVYGHTEDTRDYDMEAMLHQPGIDFNTLDNNMEKVLYNRYNTLAKRVTDASIKVNTYNNPDLNY